MSRFAETAFAKLNLALHVRGRLPDGRHRLETIFAFCEDGDALEGEHHHSSQNESSEPKLSLKLSGPFAAELGGTNLVERAWDAMRAEAGPAADGHTSLMLAKALPVASGIGGGSADAAAALRLLTRLWGVDRGVAEAVAPKLGSDVPACLLSQTCRGTGAGDELEPVGAPEIGGAPVLLLNPRVTLPTAEVFARWDGVDRGPLDDWRDGRNDLEAAAIEIVPQISAVLAWLWAQPGAAFVRMSGSGATCFALFESDEQRDRAAEAVPREWWHLATKLR